MRLRRCRRLCGVGLNSDRCAFGYRIRAETAADGKDFNQDKNVQLAAGQELYVKIVALRNWVASGGGGGDEGGGGGGDMTRETFYVWLIPAETARRDVARSAFYGGG